MRIRINPRNVFEAIGFWNSIPQYSLSNLVRRAPFDLNLEKVIQVTQILGVVKVQFRITCEEQNCRYHFFLDRLPEDFNSHKEIDSVTGLEFFLSEIKFYLKNLPFVSPGIVSVLLFLILFAGSLLLSKPIELLVLDGKWFENGSCQVDCVRGLFLTLMHLSRLTGITMLIPIAILISALWVRKNRIDYHRLRAVQVECAILIFTALCMTINLSSTLYKRREVISQVFSKYIDGTLTLNDFSSKTENK